MKRKTWITILAGILAVLVIGAAGVYAMDRIEKGSLLSRREACEFAYMDAGMADEKIRDTRAELFKSGGRYLYHVSFQAEGADYDYVIYASDGQVIKRKKSNENALKTVDSGTKETKPSAVPDSVAAAPKVDVAETEEPSGKASDSAYISVDAAKEIALKDAGVSSKRVVYKKAKLEYEDRKMIYEIEFYCNHTEYEYEIDAVHGKILDVDLDKEDDDDRDDD